MKKDIRILYICTRPKSYFEDPENQDHYLWHAAAMSIALSQFRALYLPDQKLPDQVDEDLVIIGGSNKGVNDDEPWIPSLERFIVQRIEEQKPMFGVCFGHQIIAQALGGKIEKGDKGPEIGVTRLSKTSAREKNVLFEGVDDPFHVMQFHKDVITQLPPVDVEILAKSEKYNFQALSYGPKIKTVQFHPEMTRQIADYEIQEHQEEMLQLGYFSDQNEIADARAQIQDTDSETNGQNIYQNFLKSINF